LLPEQFFEVKTFFPWFTGKKIPLTDKRRAVLAFYSGVPGYFFRVTGKNNW
jgi:hypothetical protein